MSSVEKDDEEAFSLFGEIIESKIINDRETERSRGFGFVTFNHEKNLDGRNITINEAQSGGSGDGGGGNGGYNCGGYGSSGVGY
ncbi:hypothetical protein PRUPE_6G222800 [Prunus persica]|uniref:Uncharacterized protein n=1 Tax=Prunus persica TaxID=3760 RepID=M5W3F4_PRUPE|nr:hypothetical protein PRUPE_6G222800 [Prunus persica]